jgi:hypothetical protein
MVVIAEDNLVHQAAKRIQRFTGQPVAGLNFQCFFETSSRPRVHLLTEIGAAQIVMRKMPGLISFGFSGAL